MVTPTFNEINVEKIHLSGQFYISLHLLTYIIQVLWSHSYVLLEIKNS